jgi:hypothetical protein
MKLDELQLDLLSTKLFVLNRDYGISCMAVVCSCGQVLGCKDGQGNYGISHGLCIPCRDATLAEARRLSEKPKFDKTYCSQCGREFGPGDHGYSHCKDHRKGVTA